MKDYDEILSRLKADYEEKTGTLPDKASDIGIRLSVLSGELFSLYAQLYWLQNQMFPSTAEGEYLERHAAQRGLTRKSGTKAVGEVDFYLPYLMNEDVEVPQGTVIATEGADSVRFETDETIIIRAGTLAGHAYITALEEGENGNVAEQTITVLVTPVARVTRVQNDYRTELGSDIETDEELRRRVLDSFVRIPNGTNGAYYLNEALAVEGVTAAGVIPRNRGAGTVDVFIAGPSGTPSLSLINRVKQRLQSAREINVDVEVAALTFVPCNVYLEMSVIKGYDFEEVKNNCIDAIEQYFSTLGGGETVYLSSVGKAVSSVEGVKDFTFVGQLMHDMAMSASSAARCGTVSITERD